MFFLKTLSLLLVFVTAVDEKPVSIPLDQVWAYNMPGTRDCYGMDLGDFDQKHRPIPGREEFRQMRERAIHEAHRALAVKLPSEQALNGFVIPRKSDLYVLRKASIMMASAMRYEKKGFVRASFPVGDEMTLCFFSHPSSYYIHLKEIGRRGTAITVRYQAVPHYTAESSVHFALIPLGKLSAGEYQVRFEQMRMDQAFHDAGFILLSPRQKQRTICQPFSFTVFDPPVFVTEEDPDAEKIPLDQIWALEMPGTKNVRQLQEVPLGLSRVERHRRSLVAQIRRALRPGNMALVGKSPGPILVVKGTGLEALKETARLLKEMNELKNEKEPELIQPLDTELTLVFYAYMCGHYIHLTNVERNENMITVKYRFVTHRTTNMSTHFALIPLGKDLKGNVSVKVVEEPPIDGKGNPGKVTNQTRTKICDSVSFRTQ